MNLGVGIKQSFVRRGDRTKFWLDNWVGENTLKLSCNRLFRLSLQQDVTVSEMGSWVNEVVGVEL